MAEQKLILYDHPVSSYCQKVRIALREKNLPFTLSLPPELSGPTTTSATKGPLFASNPRGEVPVLIDDDFKVFDSTIIMEYLEDKFPDTPMLPRDPGERAKARLLEEVCDTQYEAVNWGIAEVRWYKRAEGALAEQLLRQGRHHTEVLQKWLEERLGGKDWFGGDRFGWGDACVAPIVNRSVTYGFGPNPASALGKWYSRVTERPSLKETFEEYRKGVETMPALADVFRKGERKREYRSDRLEWMIKAGGLDVVADGLRRNNIQFSWPSNV